MTKRFIPSRYQREFYHKFLDFKQGFKSVDKYYKEMEVAIVRANIEEDVQTTMAGFMSGLDWEIENILELHNYVELEDLVHMAMKVER